MPGTVVIYEGFDNKLNPETQTVTHLTKPCPKIGGNGLADISSTH